MNNLHRLVLRIAALVLFAGLAAAIAQPQANDNESGRLDQAAATLKQIYATLQQPGLSKADLEKLKGEAQPIGTEIQAALERLTPRLDALKVQLAQLGPAPGPKAKPEAPQIASEREKRQKAYDDIDALVKRANLLSVQAEQANARIVERERAKLAQALFARGPSLANPTLWMGALAEVPHDLAAAKTASVDWLSGAAAKLPGLVALGFWTPVALILVLYRPALWLAGRGASPRAHLRNRLQKIFAAWQVALVVAGLPIAATAAIGAIALAFGLIDPSERLARSIFIGVVRVALVAGIARGLLAPGRQDRQLLKLDDATCEHVLRTALVLAILVSASHVVESFAEAINASATLLGLLQGAGAFLAALVLATALWIRKAPEDGGAGIAGPRHSDSDGWYSLLRLALWIAIVAIVTAVLMGFMQLGRFLVSQIIWVGGVGAITAMLAILVEQMTRVGFAPRTRLGRNVMLSTGLRRDSFEQLAVFVSGVTRVVIFIVAALIALAPWGVQSTDVSGYLYAAFFGFKIGTVTISLSRIALALIIFVAGCLVTRTIERWLDVSFLPRTRLDTGLRNSITTSFRYIGWILSLGIALAYLGLDFEKLALVAGALSVGIGFGLQSIVNNFVSGLILLWERAIRVGDWIRVGPNEGYVRRINVRSTEIETFDCAAVVIPNSDLVAGVVKNFLRTDSTGRVEISIAVNPAADPEKARDILLDIAKAHKLVLEAPPPHVVFTGITSSAFNFELYCFIADVATLAGVKSDLHFAIYHRFTKENLFLAPPPVLVVNLPEIEKQGILFKTDGAAKQAGEGMSKG